MQDALAGSLLIQKPLSYRIKTAQELYHHQGSIWLVGAGDVASLAIKEQSKLSCVLLIITHRLFGAQACLYTYTLLVI